MSMYRITYPTKGKNTFFSDSHETFNETDQKLGHKPRFSKFQMIEILQSMFSDSNSVKWGPIKTRYLEIANYLEME